MWHGSPRSIVTSLLWATCVLLFIPAGMSVSCYRPVAVSSDLWLWGLTVYIYSLVT